MPKHLNAADVRSAFCRVPDSCGHYINDDRGYLISSDQVKHERHLAELANALNCIIEENRKLLEEKLKEDDARDREEAA